MTDIIITLSFTDYNSIETVEIILRIVKGHMRAERGREMG